MSENLMSPHTLSLSERKKLSLTGVQEVVSFDEQAVVLKTPLGNLVVQGENLQLKQLIPDGGDVAVEGEISSLAYEQLRRSGWLARLFG